MRKRVTIRDVAAQAGVSIATVSFVLNRHPGEGISEKVRQRVLQVATELDYHPSAAAAGLARRTTRNLAMIFYKDSAVIANQFYSFVVQGVIKETMLRDYNLLFSFVDTTYEGYAHLPKVLREKNAAGALCISFVSPKMLADIQSNGVPVLAIDEYPRVPEVNSLQIDGQAGTKLAASHLLELGHRRIAFMHGSKDRPSIQHRAAGFRLALQEAGHTVTARHMIDCGDLLFWSGYERGKALLSEKTRPTGLVCANDEVAAGVLRAAHELSLSVPRDLSIVGFDNITMASYTDPPLTTVSVDKEAMGRRAVERLIALIETKSDDVQHEFMPVHLVERASTAAPPTPA
jgi:LacI family repressor for deo operon, udp, cdd, tsx, nupC, and nupG